MNDVKWFSCHSSYRKVPFFLLFLQSTDSFWQTFMEFLKTNQKRSKKAGLDLLRWEINIDNLSNLSCNLFFFFILVVSTHMYSLIISISFGRKLYGSISIYMRIILSKSSLNSIDNDAMANPMLPVNWWC